MLARLRARKRQEAVQSWELQKGCDSKTNEGKTKSKGQVNMAGKKSPAWTRKEGQNPQGGLNAKGRASAKAQGMNLKPPVSKEQASKGGAAAGRRASFCARMSGMKAKLTGKETAKDPNSRINKALRKWDC